MRPTSTPSRSCSKLDTNHDGKISVEEFRAPRVAAFNRADTNHDGVLTAQEQQAAAGKEIGRSALAESERGPKDDSSLGSRCLRLRSAIRAGTHRT